MHYCTKCIRVVRETCETIYIVRETAPKYAYMVYTCTMYIVFGREQTTKCDIYYTEREQSAQYDIY